MNILSKFRLMVGMAGLLMLGAGKGEAALGPPIFNPVNGVSFGATQIPLASATIIPTTTLSFSLANSGSDPLTGVGFVANFGPGLKIASPNGLSGACGVLPNATSGATSLTLTGGSLGGSGGCSFTINVVGAAAGNQAVTAGPLTSNETGTNALPSGSATATIAVVAPASFSKQFFPAQIPLMGLTRLTFTIGNPPVNTKTINSILMVDSFVDFLTVAPVPNILTSAGCAGATITAPAGSGSIIFTDSSLPLNTTCIFGIDLIGIAPAKYTNSAVLTASNTVPSSPASADITVVGPPKLLKSFSPDNVALNGTSVLTFTITSLNIDSTAKLTGINFTDTLPAGLVITSPGGPIAVCPLGGQLTTTASTISLTVAKLDPNQTCTFSVTVTGTSVGTKNNLTSTIGSIEGGPGNPATATLLVLMPPMLTKSFTPSTIPLNGPTTLSFVITNPNPAPITNVTLTDTFPAGLVATGPPVTNCLVAPIGISPPPPPEINITILSLAAGGSCSLTIPVTGTVLGSILNTATITSTVGGGSGTSTLFVVGPPAILKTFTPNSILPGGVSTITFKITNPNAITTLTGIGFTDLFPLIPLGLVVATPANVTNNCGGTFIAPSGAVLVSLTGVTQNPTQMCTITVDVTSATGGTFINSTGPVTSVEGGSGAASSDTLTVISPPSILKSFLQPNPVSVTGTTKVKFVISNSNTTLSLLGVSLIDVLPAGLLIGTPNNATNTCGGTLTALPGTSLITLTGVTLTQSANCMITMDVLATMIGDKVNTVSVTSTNAGTGLPSTATLMVNDILPPTLTKDFVLSSILLNGNSSLTIRLTNPIGNTVALLGVAFNDNFPVGLSVASPNGLSTTCSGIVTANPGSGAVSLAGATLAVNTTCTITVTVTATTVGDKFNTTTPTSTNGGTGLPGSATLKVFPPNNNPPILTKAFATKSVLPGGVVALTFTLLNPSTIQITNVGFTDVLPGGFLVTNPNGLVNTCGGVAVATPTTPNISLSGVTMLPGASCTLTLNVTAPNIVPPVYICNTTSTVTWSGAPPDGNPATTCITVGDKPIAPPDAFQIRYAAHLDQGDSYINLTNNGANGAPYAGPGFGYPVGNICVNAYVFSPDEQLISCCSCLVTPNGLNSLSVKLDLVSNTLTGLQPNSVVIKLLASQPVGPVCNAALPNMMNLAPGMNAWGTTIHQAPNLSYTTTETPFIRASLSDQELASITNRCANNIGNGSGFGICRSCRAGGFAPIPIAGLPENR